MYPYIIHLIIDCVRDNQKPPHDFWHIWMLLAGRGFGKTKAGATAITQLIEEQNYKNIAFIGQSMREAFSVMIYGVSGLLSCIKGKVKITKSEGKILWPHGAVGHVFGGDTYEKLRGPQFDLVWIDELAKFKYPEELWMQVMMTLRLGNAPKCIITTTPKAVPLLHQLTKDPSVHTTYGSTFDNKANLSPLFLNKIETLYKDTKMYAQEIEGKLLEIEAGGLFRHFYYKAPVMTDLVRIVIGVDPASGGSNETGIIVAARDYNGIGYILADLSINAQACEWAKVVVSAYHQYQADRVVAEENQGGDMVEHVIKAYDRTLSYKGVRARRGKYLRAEPIAAFYEQGRIFHAKYFGVLEQQMRSFTPEYKKSPDRLDALVWALTELFVNERGDVRLSVI